MVGRLASWSELEGSRLIYYYSSRVGTPKVRWHDSGPALEVAVKSAPD